MDPAYRGLDEYLSRFDEIHPTPHSESVYLICIDADASRCIRIVDMQFECDTEKQEYGEVLGNCVNDYISQLNDDGIIVEEWTLDVDEKEDWHNYLKNEGYSVAIVSVKNITIK